MSCNDLKILGINTIFNSLNYKGFVKDEFRSNTSFLDYDAVIIDTRSLAMKYERDYPSTYAGKRLIGKDESQLMIEDFARVKIQIIELLKQGKNVFILMSHNENCYVHTGRTEYSGTGKNARGTNIVVEFDTFSFLPVDLKPTLVSGEDFKIACQPPYSTFFNSAKELIYYDAYFDVSAKNSLLKIPNSEKSISAVFEYEKGKVIILPCVCDKDWFEDEKTWKKIAKKYLDALCELNKSLISSKESYKLPMWSESIKIIDEEYEEKKLQEEMTKLKNIEEKIKNANLSSII